MSYAPQGAAIRRSGEGWTALCPAHDDNHPILSISQGDEARHDGLSVSHRPFILL